MTIAGLTRFFGASPTAVLVGVTLPSTFASGCLHSFLHFWGSAAPPLSDLLSIWFDLWSRLDVSAARVKYFLSQPSTCVPTVPQPSTDECVWLRAPLLAGSADQALEITST